MNIYTTIRKVGAVVLWLSLGVSITLLGIFSGSGLMLLCMYLTWLGGIIWVAESVHTWVLVKEHMKSADLAIKKYEKIETEALKTKLAQGVNK